MQTESGDRLSTRLGAWCPACSSVKGVTQDRGCKSLGMGGMHPQLMGAASLRMEDNRPQASTRGLRRAARSIEAEMSEYSHGLGSFREAVLRHGGLALHRVNLLARLVLMVRPERKVDDALRRHGYLGSRSPWHTDYCDVLLSDLAFLELALQGHLRAARLCEYHQAGSVLVETVDLEDRRDAGVQPGFEGKEAIKARDGRHPGRLVDHDDRFILEQDPRLPVRGDGGPQAEAF